MTDWSHLEPVKLALLYLVLFAAIAALSTRHHWRGCSGPHPWWADCSRLPP